MRWYKPVIPAFGRLRQDFEFKARPVSRTQNKNTKESHQLQATSSSISALLNLPLQARFDINRKVLHVCAQLPFLFTQGQITF
jgi:hypothetical protein